MSEPQYSGYASLPRNRLGLRASVWYDTDPRSLLFSMARYKLVAKMLTGKAQVLEIGCGDGFCSRLVAQEVKALMAIDFDPVFIQDAVERQPDTAQWQIDFFEHDILSGPIPKWEGGPFDAAYALDVLEHIAPGDEPLFMANVCASLKPDGVLIIGTPSAESQAYASAGSKAGHVNCQTQAQLRELMARYFVNVFSFGMQDEVLHTGFAPMCNYLLTLGVGQKEIPC